MGEYVSKTKADPANTSLTVFGNMFLNINVGQKDGTDTEQ